MLVNKYIGNEMHELDFCRDNLVIVLREDEIKEIVDTYLNLSDEEEALYDELNELKVHIGNQADEIEKVVDEIDDVQLLREKLLNIVEKLYSLT